MGTRESKGRQNRSEKLITGFLFHLRIGGIFRDLTEDENARERKTYHDDDDNDSNKYNINAVTGDDTRGIYYDDDPKGRQQRCHRSLLWFSPF